MDICLSMCVCPTKIHFIIFHSMNHKFLLSNLLKSHEYLISDLFELKKNLISYLFKLKKNLIVSNKEN